MKDHIEKIVDFYRSHKRIPSYSEVLKVTGLKSKNAVYKTFQKMIALGMVKKDGMGKMVPQNIFEGTRLLGLVEAGFPSPAEEETLDTMNLDDYLINNKQATYMLQVNGESMIDAGIRPGDLALVERTNQAKDGEIVIAEIDGKWTMKYLRNKNGNVFLEAANKKFPAFYPKEELKIAAVVVAIIRKYS